MQWEAMKPERDTTLLLGEVGTIQDDGYYGATERSFFERTFSSIKAGSVRGSIFTLASTAIGAGVLSLPLVLRNAGFFLGFFLVLFGAALAIFSMELLILAADKTGHKTYASLATGMFGPKAGTLIEATLVIYCFGAVVAYLVVIGSSFNAVLTAFNVTGFFANTTYDVILVTVVIVLPLSMLKDVSGLRYASMMAVGSMLYVSLAVLIHGVQHATTTDIVYVKIDWKIFSCMTITFFAYTCHVNVFSVYSELNNPLVRRMRKVMWRSVYLETLLYGTVAIFGFLTFHDDTKGNILDNFPADNTWFVIGRICVATTLSVAVPINVNPCRTNLLGLLYKTTDVPLWKHVAFTLLIVVPACVIAIVAPGVSTVFGLLGATCCVIMCFWIPILCYEKTFRDELPSHYRYALFGVLAFVTIVGICSIAENTVSLIKGEAN